MYRFLISFLMLLLPLSVHSYDDFDRPLSLVTGNKYAPFADQRLAGGGMITEIVTTAFAVMERRIHIRFRPWRRAFMGVERGIYAGTFPHFYNEELAEYFDYSDPIYPIRQRIYVSAASPLNFKTLRDLANYRLCSPIGRVLDERVQKLVDTATISIISPASLETCAHMLMRGRVDFMVLDETVYTHTLSHLNLKAVGEVLESEGLFLLLPKDNPYSFNLLWEFNTGLQYIKDCGMFDSIVTRHLKRYPQMDTDEHR